MNKKTAILAALVGLALVAGVALRSANRADAAAGNCYADTQGPSEPTVCN
jgi:hypothetical protein